MPNTCPVGERSESDWLDGAGPSETLSCPLEQFKMWGLFAGTIGSETRQSKASVLEELPSLLTSEYEDPLCAGLLSMMQTDRNVLTEHRLWRGRAVLRSG